MSDYVIMPSADYKAACDSIRAKTKKTDLIKSGDMATEIDGISGGASFNIHYGLNPPDDTSMLWVETESEPTSMAVRVSMAQHVIGEPSVESLTEKLHASISYCGSAVYGDYIYLFGGSYTSSYTTNITRFNTKTRVSERLDANLPTAVMLPSAATIGTKIYIFGGQTSNSFVNTICVFDTENETIKTLSKTLPVGSKIYLFGGTNNTVNYNTIHMFDPETEEIEQIDEVLKGGYNAFGYATDGTSVYFFGGYTSNGVYALNVTIFDTTTNTMREAGVSIPQNTWSTGAVIVGENIFYFTRNKTILVYNIPSGTLEPLDITLPDTRTRYGFGAVGGEIYLLGGESASNTIVLFKAGQLVYSLAESNGFAKVSNQKNFFDLVSGDTSVNIGVAGVYIGNADGYGEQVKAYLHNGTEWEEI